MEISSQAKLLKLLKTFAKMFALFAILIAAFSVFKTFFLSQVGMANTEAMKLWTVLCVALTGSILLGLGVRIPGRKGLFIEYLRQGFTVFVLCVGVFSGFEHLVSWNFQSHLPLIGDLFLDRAEIMSFQAAINFACFGYILLGIGSKKIWRKNPFSEGLCVFTSVMNYVTCVGILFGIKRLYLLFPTSAFPFFSSLSCLFLSLSILLSIPHGRVISMILSQRMGGILFKRYLPEIFFFPLLTGVVKVLGERIGFFDAEIGMALVVALSVGFLLALVWRSARLLDSLDEERSRFSTALGTSNQDLESKVKARTSELQDSEVFLKSLIENIPNMIFVKDAEDLRFIEFNKAGEELLGYKRKDLIGKNDYDFFPKEQADFFTKKDRDVLLGKRLVDIPEEEINTRDKGLRVLHTQKIPVLDQSGAPRYLLGVSEDITELKNAQKTIKEHQSIIIAEARMAEVGAISGGLAHEINNPLGIIQLEAGLLKMHADEAGFDIASVKKSAERIENTAHRIAKVIKGLRTFAGDSDSTTFRKVTLYSIFEISLGLCQQKFKSLGVSLEVEEISPAIEIDCLPVEISQVIYNILSNALDAALKVESKWVKIGILDSLNEVEISFLDSGQGISSETRDKIFLPFFTTKEIGKGMGLGLSISKGIVEKHRGTLKLDTTSPQTRFVLRLPKERWEAEKRLTREAS